MLQTSSPRKLLIVASTLAMLTVLSAAAHAASVTFVFNASNIISIGSSTPLTGNLTVTITDVVDTNSAAGGKGTQNLLFQVTNNTNGDLDEVKFNYVGGLYGSAVVLSGSTGLQPTITDFCNNCEKDASLKFDFTSDFPGGNPANRLGPHGSTTASFTLDASINLYAESFTTPALAHLISLDCAGKSGDTDCGSIKVGSTRPSQSTPGSQVIPEPSAMFLLGTGLAGIAAGVRWRRNAGKRG